MITMAEALAQINELTREATAELSQINDGDALEQFRIKYLGSNGRVKGLMKLLGQVPKEDKPALGQRVNAVKDAITGEFEARKASLAASTTGPDKDYVDVTEPGLQPQIGARHILMKVADELVELFARMGFAVAEGPEVEDEFHNFIALNIPESHPARDPLDNFYLEGAAVNRVEPADRVVGDKVEPVTTSRVPCRQRSRQTWMARPQDAEPATVDEDAAGFVDDRAHRRPRGDLSLYQRVVTGVGRREDFHRSNGRLDPLADERESGIVQIDELVQWPHGEGQLTRILLRASLIPGTQAAPRPASALFFPALASRRLGVHFASP